MPLRFCAAFVLSKSSMAVAVSKSGVIRVKQLNLSRNRKCGHLPNMRECEREKEREGGESLRRSSVRDTKTRNRPYVAKATWPPYILQPVHVKPSLPSARSVFVVEGVHTNVSNASNFAQQVCGNQESRFFCRQNPTEEEN